jgi:ribokinase
MARIAVLGSANMDLVVTVDRAPGRGETVHGTAFRTVPGGKGANQALAAARAGGSVSFGGAVGVDSYGAEIRSLLAGEGVDVSGLVTAADATGTAHITVDASGANSIVVVAGANASVGSLTDAHRSAIARADVLLLQLELPMTVVVEAAQFARSSGVTTVLTAAPVVALPDALLDATDLIVANEHEAVALAGLAEPEPIAAAHELARPGRDVLVTLGAAGSAYVRADSPVLSVPAFRVEVVDTTAAGDTFVGAFAVARTEGTDLADALRWASAAAALAVQRLGASASMPHRAEIDALDRRS